MKKPAEAGLREWVEQTAMLDFSHHHWPRAQDDLEAELPSQFDEYD